MVWTSQGQIPIDELQENDHILTRATSSEFGVKSDEVVANPTGGRAEFWGFNNDDVFFTAGHVFHTTTGHRAIDPLAAKRENPWLEVGRLRVGHTLLQTSDGESYEYVTIKRLHSQSKECDHVWGVHLREGLRSYHANGYLVRLNYPEVTVKSIADIIKTLSKEQTVAIMGAIKELKPIFARFGAGTVEYLLERELSDDEFLKKARHKSQDDFDPQPLYFQSRSFDLESYKEEIELKEGWYLPQIDAVDGVLYVEEEPIERSKIYKRGFSWSRLIGDDLWEHGMCTFGHDKEMISGDGLLWIEKEVYPSKPASDAVRFIAYSTALRQGYTTPPLNGQHVEFSVSECASQQVLLEAPMLSVTKINPDASETEKLLMSNNDTKEWFDSTKTLKDREQLADSVEGRPPRSTEDVMEKADLTWQLLFDRAVYDENDDPHNVVPYLSITRVYKSEPGAPPTVTVKVPFLDRLAKVRQIATGSKEEITYYSAGFTITRERKLDLWLNIENGEAIALAADDNVNEDGEVKTYENLTFKKSGFDQQLPFVFSKATFRIHNIENTIKGRISEYDENEIEYVGRQHWLVGRPVKAEPATSIISGGSTSSAVLSSAQPAPGTNPSTVDRLKSLINLGRGLGVDGELVKNTAQGYIYKAMLYHMEDSDREIFTREAKPSTTGIGALPQGLAGDLDEDLRTWLKKTYSVAYIANMMSQQSETEQKKMKTIFTEEDVKRLKYFWQGRGSGCLSQSTQYSQLNSIASTTAFRTLYTDLMIYINDGEAEDVLDDKQKPLLQQTGGRKWAYKYFNALTVETWVNQNASQIGYHETTSLNPLEFHTTILSALWIGSVGAPMDGSGLAKILTMMVHRQVKDSSLFAYKLMTDGKVLASGLNDCMGPLIDLLMDEAKSKEAGINPSVRQKLLDDMNSLVDKEKLLQDKALKKNVEAYNKAAAASVKASMSALLAIKQGKDYGVRGFAWVLKKARDMKIRPPGGESGIELQSIGDKSGKIADVPAKVPAGDTISKVSFGAKALAVAGFLFTIAATAWFVVQTWDSWKRIGSMTALEQTELVGNGLQTLGGLAFNAFRSVQLYKYGFQGPPKGAQVAVVQEAEHAAAEGFENAVKRRQSWINPQNEKLASNPILQQRRATAPMKLGENTAKAASVNEQVLPKTTWQKFKGKMQFGVLETSIRVFAIAVTIVLIVVSIISTIQSWNDKSPLEKWMAVIGIIIQIVAVIIEIAVLFTAVSPFLTVGIIVIGLIFQVVCHLTQKKQEPEDTPVQNWFKNVWPGFQSGLPKPPRTRFKWSISPTGAKVDDDTAIVITGTALDAAPDHQKNLSSIDFTFTISKNDASGLLNASSLKKASSQFPAINEVAVIIPETFASYTISSIQDTSVSQSTLRQYTARLGLRDAGELYYQSQYKDKMPFLDKCLVTGTVIKFVLRGIVNKRLKRPQGAKNEAAGVVPEWAKYRFKLQEHYTDSTGAVPEDTREEELVFEKLTQY